MFFKWNLKNPSLYKLFIISLFLTNKSVIPSEKADLKTLDPLVKTFLNNLEAENNPPIYTLTPKKARAVLDELQAESVNKIPADIQDCIIPCNSADQISIRIIRPKGNQEKLPVIMYFHGGGWILGNKDTHDYLIRKIANQSKAAVVFVNYSLSPEAKYPKAIEQAYAATDYIARHANKLNLDGNNLIVAGDSVGGNMAIAVTLLAKERRGPHIKYQVLFYPVTDSNFNTNSYKKYGGSYYWLTKKSMEWFWNAYAPYLPDRDKITASPLKASIEELKGLPSALIITDENDVLRDEGEAYAHKLMQAGVEVIPVRYLGTTHDFVMLAPLKKSQAAESAIELATQKIKAVFKQ